MKQATPVIPVKGRVEKPRLCCVGSWTRQRRVCDPTLNPLLDNGGRSHKSAKADSQDLPQHANCTFSTLPKLWGTQPYR